MKNANLQNEGMLSRYRALDLTDEQGFLCGKILADLGADVIKIEKPGGDAGRHIGPFYHNIPDPEKSLYWFSYNINKRGITLNLESTDGHKIFLQLVETADFVIESFPVGYLDKLGLGYSELSKINPRIIVTSITPFGQTGPYNHYKSSDLIAMAMGGLMYITGTPERPPVRISIPQSGLEASAHAAAATMIAHYHRGTTGEGQHVDVSIQQCVAFGLANAIPLWELNHIILKRVGSFLSGRAAKAKIRLVWPCKDGYVLFFVLGGSFGTKTNKGITRWMNEEGMATEFLLGVDWDSLDMATQTQEMQDQIEEPIAKFLVKHTKAELYEKGMKRDIMIYPISSPRDIAEDVQLKARDFWLDIEHPELGASITYPGTFAKLSETPCVIKHRAPLIGEHNLEIYEDELRLSRDEICVLKQAGVI